MMPVADREELERRKKIEELRQQVFSKYLTKEARERLSNLRFAHPELAESVETMLIQAAMANQLKAVIDDKKLKELLTAISGGEKKDAKITIKRAQDDTQ